MNIEVASQREEHRDSYLFSRWLFLRALGLINLVAYLSLSVQILMLNGENGILPVADFLARFKAVYETDSYKLLPTIFWINSSDPAIFAVCVCGVFISIFVILGFLTAPSLTVLSVLYASLANACPEFMAFQSDGLLVESNLMALFMVPWCLSEHHSGALRKEPTELALLPVRVLIFRLMFAAGIVKIASGDATWRDFTALGYHQETQPIPTPLAWFVHHLPMCIHKMSAGFMFFAELIVPPMCFANRDFRLFAAVVMSCLHVGIFLTGNYTFLNLLSIVLCIPLVDDAWFEKLIPFNLGCSLRRRLFGELSAPAPKLSGLRKTSALAYLSSVCLVVALSACQFTAGLVGTSVLPSSLGAALNFLAPYRIFNNYGLFAVMTTTRPEIVLEGSMDGESWKPYTFKYKVDDLRKAPPVVAPHMPRLDWRLWFASMSDVSENPWVLSMTRLMLKGDAAVLKAFRDNPFPDSPPRLIRAYVYDYHFSDWQSLREKGEWWRRDNKRIYFPPMTLNERGEIVPGNLAGL